MDNENSKRGAPTEDATPLLYYAWRCQVAARDLLRQAVAATDSNEVKRLVKAASKEQQKIIDMDVVTTKAQIGDDHFIDQLLRPLLDEMDEMYKALERRLPPEPEKEGGQQ